MADPSDERAVYVISVAAELAGMHPQTLRSYDRLGLVSPDRTTGRGRRYSEHDVERLREVARLSHEDGINLAGIKRIIELENEVIELRARIAELQEDVTAAATEADRRAAEIHASYRRDLVPLPAAQIVVWRPERRRK